MKLNKLDFNLGNRFLVPDPPTGYTTNYNLKKWDDGDRPGAAALNEDKDIIDSQIYSASFGYNIIASPPIQITGNTVSLLYNPVNLKLSGSYLNTIQDIASVSSPTFENLTINDDVYIKDELEVDGVVDFGSTLTVIGSASLNSKTILGVQATGKFDAVRADRIITSSAPLIGGGGLDTDQTFGLDYNIQNLKLTSNQLNTIQDIHTESSPRFKFLDITANIFISGSSGYNYINGNNSFGNDGIISTNLFRTVTGSASAIHTATGRFPVDAIDGNPNNWWGSDNTPGPPYWWQFRFQDGNAYDLKFLRIMPKSNDGFLTMQTLQVSGSNDGLTWTGLYSRLFPNTSVDSIWYTEHVDNITPFIFYRLTFPEGSYRSWPKQTLIKEVEFYKNIPGGAYTIPVEVIDLAAGNIKQTGYYSMYNDFISGWTGTGWRMDYGVTNVSASHVEVDDMTVRGTLNVYELLINQIRATNGSLIVTSAARVSGSNTVLDPPTITFEDVTGHNIVPFLENDIILCQRVNTDGTSVVKRLVYEVITVSGLTIEVGLLGDGPTFSGSIEKGDDFVRIGNTTNTGRQGVLYLTSDDSNSPFMDIVNGVDSWSAWLNRTKIKVRLGRLSGITDQAFGSLTDYGLYAKGGVYLSSDSPTGIAMKVDSGSAVLDMKQAGNSVFKFDTSSSIANIAGWTFTPTTLIKRGTGDQLIELNSTEPYIYAGDENNIRFDDDHFVLMGRLPDDVPYSGSIGLISRDSLGGVTHFVLTNTRKQIAGWQFDGTKLFNGTDIILDGTNKKVSVNNDAVKMYYTDGSNYGVSGSGFHLGSTNNIAGWTITPTYLQSPTFIIDSKDNEIRINATSNLFGTHLYLDTTALDVPGYLSFGKVLSGTGTPQDKIGIAYKHGSNNYFELTDQEKNIAGWSFDTNKIFSGSAATGISINKSSTAYITGTGIELYDSSNPKFFVGKKTGNFMDYNITNANALTVSGSIIGSSILGSLIQGSTISGSDIFGANISTNPSQITGSFNFVSMFDQTGDAPTLSVSWYNSVSDRKYFVVAPRQSSRYLVYTSQDSGSVASTVGIESNTSNQLELNVNGFPTSRWRGNISADPGTDVRGGDMYYNTTTSKVKIYVVSIGWLNLN